MATTKIVTDNTVLADLIVYMVDAKVALAEHRINAKLKAVAGALTKWQTSVSHAIVAAHEADATIEELAELDRKIAEHSAQLIRTVLPDAGPPEPVDDPAAPRATA